MTPPPTQLPIHNQAHVQLQTRLHIEPPIDRWQVAPRNGRARPVIATGHQPFFWHPGILAKDIAADAFAHQVGGRALHLVVEHNAIDPLQIDLPTLRAQALDSQQAVFDQRVSTHTTPPNRLEPIDSILIERALSGVGDAPQADFIKAGIEQIVQAYAHHSHHDHLAAQTSAVLSELKRPYLADHMKTSSTSELVTPGFLDRLLANPIDCVRCYNRAALAYPQAGIRPLYLGRDVVEAPLWAQGDGACTRVFVDMGDSKRPQLFTQGQSLDLTGRDALMYLRPRAITLSALMRSEHCDLFIHGKGGGVYDQVTERWWQDWVGEPLAPMAVVSADCFLDFDAPLTTRADLQQAVWFDHHLPFNIDRHTKVHDDSEAALRDEKRQLLDQMNDDRDKRRRAKAFRRIHAINAQLQHRHADRLVQARQHAKDARIGVRNAAIAARRDWCFTLYPDAVLLDLVKQIRSPLADPLSNRNDR